ncbi:uncharacterized protein [Ambystoma mexicanum]|uniref:uncharacterized protein n=1 Tax=Ambystoma mexicanum TaxID=8296 RepID=UPI0037E7CAA8
MADFKKFKPPQLFLPSPDAFMAKTLAVDEAFRPIPKLAKGQKTTNRRNCKFGKNEMDQNSNTTLHQHKQTGEHDKNPQITFSELEKMEKSVIRKKIEVKLQELENTEQHQSTHSTLQKLDYLKKRERLFFCHATSLSEYLKLKKVPRGLRVIQTGIEYLQSCPEVTEKLNEVTTKCSFDLMLLMLETAMKERGQIMPQIAKMEEALQAQVPKELYAQMKRDMNVKIAAFEDNLKKCIEKKYRRDLSDYPNKVYTWKHQAEPGWNDDRGSSGPGSSSDSEDQSDRSSSVCRVPSEVQHKKTRRGGRGRKKPSK